MTLEEAINELTSSIGTTKHNDSDALDVLDHAAEVIARWKPFILAMQAYMELGPQLSDLEVERWTALKAAYRAAVSQEEK